MSEINKKLEKIYSNFNLKRALRLIWEISPWRTVIAVIFMLLENACWMINVYSIKNLIDKLVKLQGVHDEKAVTYNIALAAGAAVLFVIIRNISSFLDDAQAVFVNQSVDEKIHSHIIKIDFSNYEDPAYLDILKRAKAAGVDRPYAVVASLLDIGKKLAMLASMGYILISIDWMLLPMLALFVGPMLMVRLKFSKMLYAWQRKNTGQEREMGYLSYLMTNDTSAKELRGFMLGPYLLKKYVVIKKFLIAHELKISKRRTVVEVGTAVMATSAFYAVMAYVVLGTVHGTNSISNIAVFLVIFPQSFALMQGLTAGISRLYQNNIYLADIFELFDIKPDIEDTQRITQGGVLDGEENIYVDNISFKYPHGDEVVLENVSLEIPAGKIVALVGFNGAGKSTLIKLLCRLYDPVSGRIRINNTDIKDINIADYRKQISIVFQDFMKYNMTVSENIWFGNIDRDLVPAEIHQASLQSGADSFVQLFPENYETMLGRVFDNGHEISIGQWQKIAIARALYSNSKLVIFDEATSALDAVSEHKLFETLRSILGHRSALVISHRLSTIKQADYIYVMGDKRIIEKGTHETLMALGGRYAQLYKTKQQED